MITKEIPEEEYNAMCRSVRAKEMAEFLQAIKKAHEIFIDAIRLTADKPEETEPRILGVFEEAARGVRALMICLSIQSYALLDKGEDGGNRQTLRQVIDELFGDFASECESALALIVAKRTLEKETEGLDVH